MAIRLSIHKRIELSVTVPSEWDTFKFSAGCGVIFGAICALVERLEALKLKSQVERQRDKNGPPFEVPSCVLN